MTSAGKSTRRELRRSPPTPPKRFYWKFGVAFFGSVFAWAGPTQLLLGLQMIELRPDTKEDSLALMMMLGGATAVWAVVLGASLRCVRDE